MKKLIILVLISTSLPALAGPVPRPLTTDPIVHRKLVLTARLQHRAHAMLLGVRACTPQDHPIRSQIQDFIEIPLASVAASLELAKQAAVQGLHLELSYGELQDERPGCRATLQRARKSLFERDRAKFAGIKKRLKQAGSVAETVCSVSDTTSDIAGACVSLVEQLVTEIDPFCSEPNLVEPGGYHDQNPCFAATKPILASIGGRPEQVLEAIHRAVTGWAKAVEAARVGGSVSLYSAFDSGAKRKFTYTSHRQMLGVLALLSAAGTSNLGSMDAFTESLTLKSLSESQDALTALSVYERFKDEKDYFKAVLAWSKDKKLKLRILAGDITEWNRHNFTAAALACYFARTEYASVASWIPTILGYGYESLDFKSHLVEGWKVSSSIDNFRIDTQRYTAGAAFGKEFCGYPKP